MEYSNKGENSILSEEYIAELINLNPYLSFEEKIFLYETKVVIIENMDYISLSQIEEFLSNVSLDYNYIEEGISGIYNDSEKNMKIVNSDLSEEALSILLHEILHGYTLRYDYSSYYLNEIYNEICKKEYCDEVGIKSYLSGYDNDLIIGYLLEEIVGSEVIKYYKFNADFNVIKNSLLNFKVSESDIDHFYNELESLRVYSNRQIHEYSARKKTYERIFNLLNKFYTSKYNAEIVDNIELLYILENTVLETSKVTEKLREYAANSVYYSSEYSIFDEVYGYSESNFKICYKEIFNNTSGYDNYKFYYHNDEVIINNKLMSIDGFNSFHKDFIEAIENNENLEKMEKNLINDSIEYIHNYFEKLDTDNILDMIKDINILYNKTINQSYYDMESNIIYINKTRDESDEVSLFSELLKIYTNKKVIYNKYVYNVANEMFLSEYKKRMQLSNENFDLFEHDLHIACFIYELLGEEFLYEYNFNPSSENLYQRFISTGLTEEEEVSILILYLNELEDIKYGVNNQEEVEKMIYKFWTFTKLLCNNNSNASLEKEKVAYRTMRRIEVSYIIKGTETVVLSEKNILLMKLTYFKNIIIIEIICLI